MTDIIFYIEYSLFRNSKSFSRFSIRLLPTKSTNGQLFPSEISLSLLTPSPVYADASFSVRNGFSHSLTSSTICYLLSHVMRARV